MLDTTAKIVYHKRVAVGVTPQANLTKSTDGPSRPTAFQRASSLGFCLYPMECGELLEAGSQVMRFFVMDTETKNRVRDRFWSKVNIKSDSECWEWSAGLLSKRYGGFYINGKTCRSHRIAWELHFGDIPDNLCVCHECDNPKCVNPNHLFLGTHTDNMQDMIRKGRGAKGVYRINNPKLSPDQIIEIRIKYAAGKCSQENLGRRYNISETQIGRIVRGEQWPHVQGPIVKNGSGMRNFNTSK